MKLRLSQIAHARSGDKGDISISALLQFIQSTMRCCGGKLRPAVSRTTLAHWCWGR